MSYANLFSPSISLVLEEWFIPPASLLLSHSLPMSLPFTVQHFHSYISNEINWLEGYTMSTVLFPLNSPNCVSKTICFQTTSFPLRNHYWLGEYITLFPIRKLQFAAIWGASFLFFVSSLCQVSVFCVHVLWMSLRTSDALIRAIQRSHCLFCSSLSVAQFEIWLPCLKPCARLKGIDSRCVLQWLLCVCGNRGEWVGALRCYCLNKRPFKWWAHKICCQTSPLAALRVATAMQSANGVLKMGYLAGLIFFYCTTQMYSIGPPLWVYVLERNLFGAFSIQINCWFAPFLIDFCSVWYWNTVFHYLSLWALFSKRRTRARSLFPVFPVLSFSPHFRVPFLSALVISDKRRDCSCYWRPKPNS